MLSKIAIGLAMLAVLAYGLVSCRLARAIVMPHGLTLDEERKWIEEHGLLGDFDRYEKEDYEAAGWQDYVLHAQLVKAEDPNTQKYVILSHGFRSNRNGSIKYVDVYRNLGYNVILYDVRGHGLNEKTTVTLGNIESKDLLCLIEDSYRRFGEGIELGLHGESMGSAISLSALAQQPRLKFVVADCGFSNLYDLIHGAYRQNHAGLLIHGVNAVSSLGFQADLKQTSPIDALADNRIPICFIHGEDDRFIPPEYSRRMYEANLSQDELHIVPQAGHAASRTALGTAGYGDIVARFLASVK